MLNFLDICFEILHLSVIFFIVSGWYFRRTRRVHLLVICLTAFSWFIFGLKYGMGYCFLTDWHFQIKRELGTYDLPVSYIKYIVDRVFSTDSNPYYIDLLTMDAFLLSALLSSILNIRDQKNKKQ